MYDFIDMLISICITCIGLSEASADNIRKAQMIFPIYCIEQVYTDVFIYFNMHIHVCSRAQIVAPTYCIEQVYTNI
jgi:hypothetical protein